MTGPCSKVEVGHRCLRRAAPCISLLYADVSGQCYRDTESRSKADLFSGLIGMQRCKGGTSHDVPPCAVRNVYGRFKSGRDARRDKSDGTRGLDEKTTLKQNATHVIACNERDRNFAQ